MPGPTPLRRLLRWPTRPAGFAVCAGVCWLAYLAAPGIGAKQLGLSPLARWNVAAGDPWRHDPAQRSTEYVGPPLSVDRSSGISLRFEPGVGGSVVVEIRWHRLGDTRGLWMRFPHPLGRSWQYFDLTRVPQWSGQVDGLTVVTPARVRGVTLEARGPFAELRRAWQGFAVPELLDESSINFLRGAEVRQTSWTVPLALAFCAFVVLQLLLGIAGRRPLDWRGLVVFALAAWILLDLRFTYDLIANARHDRKRFPVIADASGVVDSSQRLFRATAAKVDALVPPGASMRFVTGLPDYENKAPFVFFPRAVRSGPLPPAPDADYVVIFAARNARFDPGHGVLTLPDGASVPARIIGQVPGAAYVFAVEREPRR